MSRPILPLSISTSWLWVLLYVTGAHACALSSTFNPKTMSEIPYHSAPSAFPELQNTQHIYLCKYVMIYVCYACVCYVCMILHTYTGRAVQLLSIGSFKCAVFYIVECLPWTMEELHQDNRILSTPKALDVPKPAASPMYILVPPHINYYIYMSRGAGSLFLFHFI